MTNTVRHGNNAGFTLLELMITIAIVGILAAVAIPNFRDFIFDNRRAALTNELITSMALARSEAGKRNRTVSLCSIAASDAMDCRTAALTNWTYGWIVFVNLDNDRPADVDTAEETLILQRFVNTQSSFKLLAATGLHLGTLSFRPFNTVSVSGNIKVCDPRDKDTAGVPEKSRVVLVESSGRARIDTKHEDNSALVNDCPS